MKQDVILISRSTEHSLKICEALKRIGIDVFQSESIDNVKAGLVSHSPAFLLLDIDIEGSKAFLREMPKGALYSLSYIVTVDIEAKQIIILKSMPPRLLGETVSTS